MPLPVARGVISGYVLVMCAILLAGWRFRAEVTGAGNLAAGVISGLANAPGMGGLPVAAFFAAQPMPVAVFRASLVAYFPLLDLYGAPLYFLSGLVSWDTLWASLLTLPMVIFSKVKLGVIPEVNALATLVIAIVSLGVLIAGWNILKKQRSAHG